MSHKIKWMFGVLVLTYCSLAFALVEDNKEKMVITADSSIYNYKSGYTVFEGHVKVDQGTTHLTAAKLTTKTDMNHHLQEAIAYGVNELAHYWTLPKQGDPEVHAQAKIIKLYPVKSNVALEQNVVLTRGADHFEGELIIFNRDDQTIVVPQKQNTRATLTIYPEKSNNP